MITETLLFGILLAEAIRLYSLFQKKGKKEYFKNRLAGIEQSIYDAEFQRYKGKEVKEEVRVDLTAVKSKQSILREEIKKHEESKDMSVGDIAKLKDEDERMEVKINKLIYGIGRPKLKEDKTVNEEETAKLPKEVDVCIKGVDEQLGFLNEKIDSLQELKVMVKDYIKKEV